MQPSKGNEVPVHQLALAPVWCGNGKTGVIVVVGTMVVGTIGQGNTQVLTALPPVGAGS